MGSAAIEVLAGLMPSYLTFALLTPLLGLSALTMITAANTTMQLATAPGLRGRIAVEWRRCFEEWGYAPESGTAIPAMVRGQ